MLARLGRLGVEAVALARAVAVLGVGAEVVLAARLAGMGPVAAELTADRLAAAQILAPTRPLEFRHPLIGAAVREDIAPGARRVAHRRAAELVDRAGEGSLGRVAAHLLACGPAGDEWVARRLGDAAREALERGAPEIAASYLRRALSEPPATGERAALLFLLGTAEWRTGQADAISHLEQARAEAGQDSRTLIAACAALALAYAESDRAERAVEMLEREAPAVGDRKGTLALTEQLGTTRRAHRALVLEQGRRSVANKSTTVHILRGAVIAASASHGVVDARHELFGHPGLYVVDASAIPVNLGVNPSLTITALAERFASLIPPADGAPSTRITTHAWRRTRRQLTNARQTGPTNRGVGSAADL